MAPLLFVASTVLSRVTKGITDDASHRHDANEYSKGQRIQMRCSRSRAYSARVRALLLLLLRSTGSISPGSSALALIYIAYLPI